MIVFHVDLDNTLIYSYKHDIGMERRNVEIYKEREISFITENTFELLKKVKEKVLIVPTSTRTMEQYQRIDLGIGEFQYALVCNGGILLRAGQRDEEWYKDSLSLIRPSEKELHKAKVLLEEDKRRFFELRLIEELFLFTKCEQPEAVVENLKKELQTDLVDVFHNGEKVYVVPCNLSKGVAVKRLKKMLNPEDVIAAGDSEFDISMVEAADRGLVPTGFKKKFDTKSSLIEMDGKKIFAESILEECLK